jgi:hypothetical protein
VERGVLVINEFQRFSPWTSLAMGTSVVRKEVLRMSCPFKFRCFVGVAVVIAVTSLMGCVLPLPEHPTGNLAPDENYPADWPPIATASVKCPEMLVGTYENKGVSSRGRNLDDRLWESVTGAAPQPLTTDIWLTDRTKDWPRPGPEVEARRYCGRVGITVHALADRAFRGRQLWRLTFHPSRKVESDSGNRYAPCDSFVWRADVLDLGGGDPLPGGFCVSNQLAFTSSYVDFNSQADAEFYLGVGEDGSLIMKVRRGRGPLAQDSWRRFKKVP